MEVAQCRRRLTREEARAETRERLLEAARRVFVDRGYHGATLDEVAEEAGYTKGAVYWAFASKADLFLAIFEERTRQRAAEAAAIGNRAGSVAQLVEMTGEQWVRTLRRERAWSLLLVEFEVHAARDEALRGRLREVKRLFRAALCHALEQVAGRSGEDVPVPAHLLTLAVVALGNGVLLEEFSNPSPENLEALREAGALLLRGLQAPRTASELGSDHPPAAG